MINLFTRLLMALAFSCSGVWSCVEVGDRPPGPESCDVPGQMRCLGASSLEICSQVEGWIGVLTCGETDSCFHSPLKQPACMPRFDCFDTTVNYISCDVADTLSPLEQDTCKVACKAHAENDTYEDVVNCYGDFSCDEAAKPVSCVLAQCGPHLNSCNKPGMPDVSAEGPASPGGMDASEGAGSDDDAPMAANGPPAGGECLAIATCYGACSAPCETECEAESAEGMASCKAGCVSACESECRLTAPAAAQTAFLDYGICQLVHCSGVVEGDKAACAWEHCQGEYAGCLADHAWGDTPCSETATCLVNSASSDELLGCIEVSAGDQIAAALAVYTCWQDIRDGCEGGDHGPCIAEDCSAEFAACAD